MGCQCGLVGLPGCGKTTIFNAMTAAGASGYGAQEANRAVLTVPDERIPPLVAMYEPKKISPATVEVVDIPGLAPGSTGGEGRGGRLLGHIKDVDALLHVVRCFPAGDERFAPVADVETIDLELIAADAQTLANKIERLGKRARAGDAEAKRLVADCERIHAALNEGIPARRQGLAEHERASVLDCHLVSLKPVLYVANLRAPEDAASEPVKALLALAEGEGTASITVCGRDEAEIAELSPEEQQEFLQGLGLEASSMERLIRAVYKTLRLVDFFTVGPKEVHVWTCAAGTRAPQAAGKIHTDMEKGFIRLEVMRYEDLVGLGSEEAVKKAGKLRIEGKEYVVQDGDVCLVRFNK